ncbi:MAG: hypothetical protein J5598_03030 [Clostridia bacterium]|nr:hypothetical protein [Clostridia bacterium]
MATIIEIYGYPCTGKSTFAAELFSAIKKTGLRVEMCHEVAKLWTYNNDWRMEDQLSIITAQYLENHKFDHILKKLDILIVEAPIFLQLSYGEDFPEIAHIARKKRDLRHIYLAVALQKEFKFDKFGRNEPQNPDFEYRMNTFIGNMYRADNVYKGSYKKCMKEIMEYVKMAAMIHDINPTLEIKHV